VFRLGRAPSLNMTIIEISNIAAQECS
jgi:hypothetical protein